VRELGDGETRVCGKLEGGWKLFCSRKGYRLREDHCRVGYSPSLVAITRREIKGTDVSHGIDAGIPSRSGASTELDVGSRTDGSLSFSNYLISLSVQARSYTMVTEHSARIPLGISFGPSVSMSKTQFSVV
jgi:hypothetical protein